MRIPFLKLDSAKLAVIIVAALFVFGLFFGASAGRAAGSAGIVYQNVSEIAKGLNYFYADEGRFPDAQEFSDSHVLLTYFSAVPSNQSDNSVCAQNFEYKRTSLNSYELDFCLAAGAAGFSKGWNKINLQK